MARILVIDDEELVRFSIADILAEAGHEVFEAENGREGIDVLREQPVDIVITDLLMPEQEGLETITTLRSQWPDLPVIAISGGGRTGNLDFLDSAKKLGASATLAKPFSRDEILTVLSAYI